MLKVPRMSDVISNADNEDSLCFPIDTEDECDPGLSGSTEHPQHPAENIMEVNQRNYYNQYQVETYVVLK